MILLLTATLKKRAHDVKGINAGASALRRLDLERRLF